MFDIEVVKQIRPLHPEIRIGWLCSAWDLLHAGHVLVLADAKSHCDYLVVGLHTDPTIDRPAKNKPILSMEERRIVLDAIKYVDQIIEYDTEADHQQILEILLPDVRVLGSDYVGKRVAGDTLPIYTYYHERAAYSTSELRARVAAAESKK